MLASILSGEFFSYTSSAGFNFIWGVSLTHPICMRGVSLTHAELASFVWGMFLLHIPCWLFFIFFIWWVSLSHPMLAWIFFREFLLHIPCCLHFELGSFSYASRAGFLFIFFSFTLSMLASFFNLGVSLTHLVLVSFLYEGSLSYISRAGLIFFWGICLTHPVLASFLISEFLLHITCWSYFISGVSLTHEDVLALFFCGSFTHTSHASFFF